MHAIFFGFYVNVSTQLTSSRPRPPNPDVLSSASAANSSSISASVKVRARCNFLWQNISTSAMYTALTGRWSDSFSSILS